MFDAAKMSVFSNRVKQAMTLLHDTVNREMETLDDIYVNEAESGAHVDFTDTSNATEQEHSDAIAAMRAFQTTLAAQMANITPWLQ